MKIYTYCIMSNHVHLLLRTRIVPLCKLVNRINKRYSYFFRKKHN
ncbi:transposase [Psychrobacillus psychrotolerans]